MRRRIHAGWGFHSYEAPIKRAAKGMMMKIAVVAMLAIRAAVGGRVMKARASRMAKRRAAAPKKSGRGF